MKPKSYIKDFWDNNNDIIKTWTIIVVIVTAVYIAVTFLIWGLFQPSRAVIYGVVFIFFYEVFNRLIERVSAYKKEKKNEDFVVRAKKLKEKEEKEKTDSEEDKETEDEKEPGKEGSEDKEDEETKDGDKKEAGEAEKEEKDSKKPDQ